MVVAKNWGEGEIKKLVFSVYIVLVTQDENVPEICRSVVPYVYT